MLNIYIVGCGGIGGYLVDLLPMTLAGLSLDMLDSNKYSVQELLLNAGTKAIPCIADSITLVDGDVFNARNALRQGGGAGSKLEQRMRTMRDKLSKLIGQTADKNAVLLNSWLYNLKVIGYNNYLNPDNMDKIIPHRPEANEFNKAATGAFEYTLMGKLNSTVVFLCVDNKKTRYEVSKYMESFDDCIVINGGNSKTAGQVTVYERSCGRALDPNLYEVFPDVSDTADLRPDELGCTAVAPEHDQIANTNAVIADWMAIVFNNWIRYGLSKSTGNTVTRTNEILIDTESYVTMGLYHPMAKKDARNDREEDPKEADKEGESKENGSENDRTGAAEACSGSSESSGIGNAVNSAGDSGTQAGDSGTQAGAQEGQEDRGSESEHQSV